MKRFGLHVTNWVAYVVSCSLLGKLWGTLFGFLFRGFLTDEGYAAEHPKKYLLGAIGIILLAVVSGMIVVVLPLKLLVNKMDSKIDEFADDKEWD